MRAGVGAPCRRLLALCVATLFSVGDTYALMSTINTCNDVIRMPDDGQEGVNRNLYVGSDRTASEHETSTNQSSHVSHAGRRSNASAACTSVWVAWSDVATRRRRSCSSRRSRMPRLVCSVHIQGFMHETYVSRIFPHQSLIDNVYNNLIVPHNLSLLSQQSRLSFSRSHARRSCSHSRAWSPASAARASPCIATCTSS